MHIQVDNAASPIMVSTTCMKCAGASHSVRAASQARPSAEDWTTSGAAATAPTAGRTDSAHIPVHSRRTQSQQRTQVGMPYPKLGVTLVRVPVHASTMQSAHSGAANRRDTIGLQPTTPPAAQQRHAADLFPEQTAAPLSELTQCVTVLANALAAQRTGRRSRRSSRRSASRQSSRTERPQTADSSCIRPSSAPTERAAPSGAASQFETPSARSKSRGRRAGTTVPFALLKRLHDLAPDTALRVTRAQHAVSEDGAAEQQHVIQYDTGGAGGVLHMQPPSMAQRRMVRTCR